MRRYDALRFVDPVFSSGVDVALFSALYAYEAITKGWATGDETSAFDAYERREGLPEGLIRRIRLLLVSAT